MKVLFVGHDISYVDFYYSIEKELLQRIAFSSLHLYFRPSAWLYAKLHLGLPAVSPFLRRFFLGFFGAQKTTMGTLDLRFYPSSKDATQRRKLIQLYRDYSKFIQCSLSNTNFDVAVLPGEYRIFEQATIDVINSLKQPPKVIYFEAGPPGYVYFDTNGVNANASFAATGISKLIANIDISKITLSNDSVRRSHFARKSLIALDTVWLWLAKNTIGLLDLEELWVAN